MINNEDYGESETGNWNSAKIYARDNIAKLLVEIDELIKICHFGTIELSEEFMINDDVKNIAKLKSLRRLVQTLRMIIGNTRGVLKKTEVETFLKFKETLRSIKLILPKLEDNQMSNGRIIKHGINEIFYNKMLDLLEDMHEDMIEPLNKSNLIFNPKDDFDPRKMKADKIKEMIESG